MIRIAIVDDHDIVRRGLHQIAAESSDIVVAGEAASSVAAIRMLRTTPCDVLLLDVSMPDRSGIETLPMIRREFPKLHVLILSAYPEKQYAMRALKAGASGYLTKQSAPAELLSAIRTVHAGRKYLTKAVAEELANALGQDGNQPAHEALSEREYQTLRQIAAGKSLIEIGQQMSISAKTVSVYRARLLEKMRLKNNAELTHYAITHNLLE